MPKLELVYFKMRALAEAAQLMLWATDTLHLCHGLGLLW